MPPNTFHAVYTPVRSVATGGHFYLYETMHLTELSRAFDKRKGLCVTNTSHVSAHDTLCMMMVSVIRGDLTSKYLLLSSVHFKELTDYPEFKLKPLHALCCMVLNHEDYIAQTGDPKLTRSVKDNAALTIPKLAKIVAEYLLRHFDLSKDDDGYLFRHGHSWMDPGAIADMTGVYEDWAETPLRSRDPSEERTTIHAIMSSQWKPPSERNKSPTPPPSTQRRYPKRSTNTSNNTTTSSNTTNTSKKRKRK